MTWDLAVELAPGDQPLFRQIATTIATDIERGRLQAGVKLVSSRALARQLGVSRHTAVAAYDELCARGWIAIEGTRGAFVIGVPRAGRGPARPRAYPAVAGFTLPPATLELEPPVARTPGLLLLLGGVPELRDLPHRALVRAYRAALTGRTARRLLDYGHPQGDVRLREALGDLLSHLRGVVAPVDAITIVRGSQHGVYLTARALLRPGDAVAVEALGYRPAWRALEAAGATLVPIPVDRDGLDVDALAAAGARRPIRAVYTTPHHQYPTTVTLASARRQRLLALAAQRAMIVLEDDYDYDFHYEGRPVLPLAAIDRAGVVVYLGTLSKCLAPGLRLGYVVASLDVARRIAAYRACVDVQGDQATEHAIAILLEDGEVQRHVRRVRRIYQARRDALCGLLRKRLPELELAVPSGGMALWARAPGVDTDGWARRGLAAGVAFQAGRKFRLDDQPSDFVRLGFSACNEVELREAVDRLVRARRARG